MNKQQMTDALRTGICTVTFTKVSGEKRVMPCTLMETFIPSDKVPKGTGKEKSDDVLSVFSTDNTEWRSFRVNNVTSFINAKGEELWQN